MILEREEYIEQAYFWRALSERLPKNMPLQELLAQLREEVLSTTRLPLALGFLLTELTHSGVIAPAMKRLNHYFTPFQSYIVDEAENERGRFDMRVAVEVLRREAECRAEPVGRPAMFLYQFETISRNRLRYDPGMLAMSQDPMYDDIWKTWILEARRRIGIVELADLLYVRSAEYANRQAKRGEKAADPSKPVLFGEKEGKIALANRRKDPLFLFSAMQRQLNYPAVPRPEPIDETPILLPQILRRLERMEHRIKLLEEEQKGGIDISKFYGKAPPPMEYE